MTMQRPDSVGSSSGIPASLLYNCSFRPSQTHHSDCDTAVIQDTFVITVYKDKKNNNKTSEATQHKLRPGAILRFAPSPEYLCLSFRLHVTLAVFYANVLIFNAVFGMGSCD